MNLHCYTVNTQFINPAKELYGVKLHGNEQSFQNVSYSCIRRDFSHDDAYHHVHTRRSPGAVINSLRDL